MSGGRTFKGVLVILDGVPDSTGESFAENCHVDLPEFVPVSFNFSMEPEDILGKCINLKRVGDTVTYEIILSDNLKQETIEHCKKLTACIGGYCDRPGNDKVIDGVKIRGVALTATPSDKRLKPLGEPCD